MVTGSAAPPAVAAPREATADGPPVTATASAGLPGWLRIWFRGWASTAHLVLDFVLSGAYLTLIVSALSIIVGSALLLAVPVLAVTLVLGAVLGAMERWRVAIFLGMWVPPPGPRPPGTPLWRRLALDPRAWRGLLYLALMALWGLTGGLVTTVLLLGGVGATLLLTLPLVAPDPGGLELTANLTLDQPWVQLVGLGGLLLLLVLPFAAWGMSRADVLIARMALGQSRDEEVEQLSARVDTLTETRERAVDSVEDERRRIERDLHDGPQQRLVAVAMDLGLARQRLATDPDGAAELLERAHTSAKEAVTDMRRVARGIHPPVLTDRGLDAALSALAARSPVPVAVDVRLLERPGSRLEAIAYFCVSEALTNVAKHSRAASARVEVDIQPCGATRCLVARVSDDGVGGADPTRGSGLAGLRDRVRSVDGDVLVSSPPGGPTVLTIQLPVPPSQQPTLPPAGPLPGPPAGPPAGPVQPSQPPQPPQPPQQGEPR